jgi:hypothetical protein
MYLCIFLLLSLSSSRELAMSLNQPFKLNIKFDLPQFESAKSGQTTYADLIFVMVYKLVSSGPRLLRPIYKSIIACVANIAPYTKKLAREACDGLIYLIQVCTKPEFLKEKDDNCKATTAIFECVNYLIAYHDETNQHLQVQLMKNQNLIYNLESPEFEKHFTNTLKPA